MTIQVAQDQPSTNRNDNIQRAENKSGSSWWFLLLISFSICYLCIKFILPNPNPSSSNTLNSLWKYGDKAILEVYVTKDRSTQPGISGNDLVWSEKDIIYDDNCKCHSIQFNVTLTRQSLTASSIMLAAYLRKISPSGSFESAPLNTLVLHHPLLRHPTKRMSQQTGTNLLFEDSKQHSPSNSLYWYPNITIQFVSESRQLPQALPPFMRQYMFTFPDQNGYLPPFFVNDFWNLREHYIPVDTQIISNITLPLSIDFECISFWRFQLSTQFVESLSQQEDIYGLDTEDMKKLIGETNPILLLVTFAVTLLHTIFDILAFKNDVQFWRKKKAQDLQGLSIRSIFLNAISQFIIFLYLLEEETSWLVLASVVFGIILDTWKIFKVVQITFDSFYIHVQFKKEYKDSDSKTYDDMALKYLSWISIPLLLIYSVYSLLYQTYSGWYSFIIKTLVGFVYTFGFIMMTPQLFINYRLKSVAHMPWRTFVYKALNTFIDDLFAFVIRMPTLHRLACLRDDVVFIIYLYQWYLYPVDNKRANEFGQYEHDD